MTFDLPYILMFASIGIIFVLPIVSIFGVFAYLKKRKKAIDEKIHLLKSNAIKMTPEEFMKMRNERICGRSKYALSQNFAGVYVLHNETKDMFYVGQGKEVLNRVNSHFTGKGNGDVYADYKYGDNFAISIISLEGSGYDTLNELERDTISCYDAFRKGYNKTRGNRG